MFRVTLECNSGALVARGSPAFRHPGRPREVMASRLLDPSAAVRVWSLGQLAAEGPAALPEVDDIRAARGPR